MVYGLKEGPRTKSDETKVPPKLPEEKVTRYIENRLGTVLYEWVLFIHS